MKHIKPYNILEHSLEKEDIESLLEKYEYDYLDVLTSLILIYDGDVYLCYRLLNLNYNDIINKELLKVLERNKYFYLWGCFYYNRKTSLDDLIWNCLDSNIKEVKDILNNEFGSFKIGKADSLGSTKYKKGDIDVFDLYKSEISDKKKMIINRMYIRTLLEKIKIKDVYNRELYETMALIFYKFLSDKMDIKCDDVYV